MSEPAKAAPQGAQGPAVPSQTLPTAVVGMPYHAALTASGGKPPYTWTLDPSASLPPGLQLNAASGTISGVATQAGIFFMSVAVADGTLAAPQSANGFITISVNAPLHFTATAAGDAVVERVDTNAIPFDGGLPPYTLLLVSGALPDGLSLPTGPVIGLRQFQGIATKAGVFAVVLAVTDSEAPPVTVQQSFNLRVNAKLIVQPPSPLPSGMVGQPYSFTLQASGGAPPLHWSLAGPAPAGLTLDPSTGILAGTPAQAFSGVMTVRVEDAASPSQLALVGVRLQISEGK